MDELISRQAAMLKVARVDKDRYDNILDFHDACVDSLKELPPAEPQERTGKWINGKCNKCGEHAPYWPMASTYHCSNFCPNCGARMEVEHDS